MIIYIDVVLIENIIMNYILFITTAIVLKIPIKHIRIFIASFLRSNLFRRILYWNFTTIF